MFQYILTNIILIILKLKKFKGRKRIIAVFALFNKAVLIKRTFKNKLIFFFLEKCQTKKKIICHPELLING